jgi:biopolymer transport protein ExbB
MLQEIFIAAAAGGNPSNALSQMGFEHLIHEMTTKPGDFAVSWVVLLTLIAMSAMSWYWTVINIFRATRLKSAADRVVSLFWDTPNAQDAIRAMEEQPASEPFSKIALDAAQALPTTSALKAVPPAASVRT